MEKHILEQFNDSYLTKASQLFDFEMSTLEKLDGFENLLYAYEKDQKKYVIRISHKDHQTYDQILAELEFIHYLRKNGASVVTPILSNSQSLAENLGGGFTCVGFEFSTGRKPTREDHSKEFYKEYGRSIAKMHKLAVDFRPKMRRKSWDEDSMFSTIHKYIPKEHKSLLDQLMVTIDRMNQLPKTSESYGLMHTDVHMGNFFINEGKFIIFDFDDASYKWFISDIAIVLFYIIQLQPDNEELIDFVMMNFMEGYNEIYQLDDFWFEKFDEFLKMRRLILLLAMYRSFDLTKPHPYFERYSEIHLERCKNDLPMTSIDYTKYNKGNH